MAHFPGRSPFGDNQNSRLVFEEFVPPSAWTEDSTCHYLLVDLPGFKKQELKLQVDKGTHILVSGVRQVAQNKYTRFEQSFELPKDADIEKITGKLDGEILYILVPKKIEQEHKEVKQDIIQEPEPEPEPVSDEDDNSDKKSDKHQSDDENDHKETPKPLLDEDEDEDGEKQNAYNTEEIDNKHGEKDLERKKQRTCFNDNLGQDAEFLLRLAIEKLNKNKKIVVTAIFAFSLGVLVSQKFQSNGD